MKTFNRYIYIGDIHGSKYFKSFIKNFDDDKTFFIFTGDLFDRGSSSVDVAETILKLYSEGKVGGSLGNHDLFLIFGKGYDFPTKLKRQLLSLPIEERGKYHGVFTTYFSQFQNNGGKKTIESFRSGFKYYGHIGKYEADQPYYFKKVAEIIDLLYEKFGLYYIDPLGNLSIHGGIPISPVSPDYSVIGLDGLYGLDYVKELDKKVKELDFNTIRFLTATSEILPNGTLLEDSFNSQPEELLPTWFDNTLYIEKNVLNKLHSELDKHGVKRMFCGHMWNEDNFEKFADISQYERVVRIDRSWIDSGTKRDARTGNFGFSILNSENEIVKIGDAHIELGLFKPTGNQ